MGTGVVGGGVKDRKRKGGSSVMGAGLGGWGVKDGKRNGG